MSETIIDARGRSCPEPVLLARKGLETLKAAGEKVIIYVDSPVALENVSRLVEHSGFALTVTEKEGVYHLEAKRK